MTVNIINRHEKTEKEKKLNERKRKTIKKKIFCVDKCKTKNINI